MKNEIPFRHALLPVLFLTLLIVYGLLIRPHWQGQAAIPLEIIFIAASVFTVALLFILGCDWPEIEASIVKKLAGALPAFFILFAIGLIISSWMISGAIPMLVYYGLRIIDPAYLYILAFISTIVFSSLTGTSWGSAGTIGVVLAGIAGALGAHMGITAGAIIGGAYFGDKMSPLSDTTNLAALASDVTLFDHIRSMMYTTLPSALLAAGAFFALGFIYPPRVSGAALESLEPFLIALRAMFHFNPLLLLPPAIVLYGSFRKKATIPVLLLSVLSAALLALLFQDYSPDSLIQSLYKGFEADMAVWMTSIPENVRVLVGRGGLYALSEPIVIAFMVFIFIGALDHIRAMPVVVERLFRFARGRRSVILTSLAATAFTNALTSNQYATSFIIGDAFKAKYDRYKIPRRVLSRSLEDYGTMIESLVPWTTTTVFMVATLGVPFADYWHWQLISLINIVIAPLLAWWGIGCFYTPEPEGENRVVRDEL